jgi:hypothetical protein
MGTQALATVMPVIILVDRAEFNPAWPNSKLFHLHYPRLLTFELDPVSTFAHCCVLVYVT